MTMLLPMLRMAMLLLVAVVLPQALGPVVLSKTSRGWIRTSVGILLPAVTFFLISATFFRTPGEASVVAVADAGIKQQISDVVGLLKQAEGQIHTYAWFIGD